MINKSTSLSRLSLAIFLSVLLSSCGHLTTRHVSLDGFSAAAITDTKQRVDDAIAMAAEVGIDETVRRINEDEAFVDGNSYVFIGRVADRVSLANPAMPAIVGTKESDLRDARGNSLAIIYDEADEDGAWIEYYWYKPEDGSTSRKVTWLKMADGYIFASGLYDE